VGNPTQAPNTSFLRYPGGKGRMLGFIGQHLLSRSTVASRYVEPFVGGGAVFFYLCPEHAWLSDINSDLIDIYRGIRKSPRQVWRRYCEFGSSKAEYRRVRDFDRPSRLVDRAARILYLNRTCFKGMWRHNRNGEFNVGYGGQARRWAITEEMLLVASRMLRKAHIQCGDFEDVVDECGVGDFLFLDPPYRPSEREQIHDHYVGRQFTFADHRRLAAALKRARRRGAHWALTTTTHPDVIGLFRASYAIEIPHGTGRQPGIRVANSGEVLMASYSLTGGQAL